MQELQELFWRESSAGRLVSTKSVGLRPQAKC